jgi:quercetin dioxygenase-like cupin family protein
VVSDRLRAYVEREFSDADAAALLGRLSNLTLAGAEKQSLERIQAAVVLLTRGDIERLEESARIAERDWRDALVWSGLGQGDWPGRLDIELGKEGAVAQDAHKVALDPGEGVTLVNPVGGHVTFKARSGETGGKLTVLETVVTPGDGPPLHIHAKADEAVYVLEGEIDFRVGDDVYRNRAGSFLFIPRGSPHTFQNVGREAGRMLLMFTPSGIERLFELAAASGATSADDEGWSSAARAADTEMVGPPLRSGSDS